MPAVAASKRANETIVPQLPPDAAAKAISATLLVTPPVVGAEKLPVVLTDLRT